MAFLLFVSVLLACLTPMALGANSTTAIIATSTPTPTVNSSSLMTPSQAVNSTSISTLATTTLAVATANTASASAMTTSFSEVAISSSSQPSVTIQPSSTQSSSPASSAGPVNSNWNTWSSWSACTKSCDNGTQSRTRSCNPPPQNGSSCAGSGNETQHCNTKKCPVRMFSVSMKFTSEQYDNNLADKSSPQYNNLKYKVENAIRASFANDPTYQGMQNLTFTQGSVIATYVLVFGPKNSSSLQDPAVVLQQAVSSGSFVGLTVDKNSFTVAESVNGLNITVWVTDETFCISRCCTGTPGQIWQNRTCSEINSSCAGIPLDREIKCEESECAEKHCDSNAVARNTLSPLAIMTAVSFLLLTA